MTAQLVLSAGLALVGAAGVLLSRKRFGDLLAPLGIMSLSWWVPLSVCATGIIAYDEISAYGWTLFGLSFGAFAAGCLIVPPVRRDSTDSRLPWSKKRLFRATLVLFACGAVAAAINAASVVGLYGLSTYLQDPLVIREHFAQEGWAAVYVSNYITIAMLWLCWRVMPERRWFLGPMLIIAVLSLVLAAQRRGFVTAVVVAFVAQQFIARTSYRRLVAVTAVVVGFFIAYGLIKSPYYAGDWRFYVQSGTIRLPQSLAPLSSPLFYLTSSFPAFDAFANSNYEVPRGETFIAFVNLASKFDPSIEQPSNILESIDTPLKTNVYTYLRPFYADFGATGIVFFPFLIGLTTTWIYTVAVRTRCLTPMLLYSTVAWCVLIAFFSNHFIYTATMLMATFSILAGGYVDNLGARWLRLTSTQARLLHPRQGV
jgi:oligosaccharide repeat unit polymerase